MSWINEVNQWVPVQLISFIGIGAFLDMVTPLRARSVLATHLSAKGFASQKEFECQMISGLIDLLLKSDGSISVIRIVAMEILTIGLLFAILLFTSGDVDLSVLMRLLVITIPLMMFAIGPDIFSVFVSKKIFHYRYYKTRYMPIAWIADVGISLAPFGMLCLLVTIVPDEWGDVRSMVMAALIFITTSVLTSIILNIIQAIAIIGGVLVKLLSYIDRIYEGGLEKAANRPITLTFSLAGIAITLVELAILQFARM